MNMKIIQYDIRAVWNDNIEKYMVYAGYIINECICCNHSCKKLLSVDMGFWDFILWNLRGMKVIRKNEYIVPNAYWVFIQLYLAVVVGVYPVKDLHMAGQQILLKSGNRKAWWFGKVIWNILSVLGFYLVLYLSVTAVSIVTGGFKAAQPEGAAFLLENQKIENAGTELYMYAMAVPVIVSLAIAVTQMMIAVVFQPPMGYIWVCAVIAAGIFLFSPYSLGYYLMLYSAKDTDKIFQMVMGWDVDGVIAISFSKSNCEKIYQLINKPIVSIDAYGELDAGQEKHVLNIGLDDESGGYLMTKYLLECGYEHIQVCAGRDNGVDHLRYMGAQRAAKDFAKKKQKVQFTALGMNYAKRKESYAWLLQRKKPKAALFFLSDLYALEAISFFSSRGVKIPEEIGIAGYDNISYAEFSVPRLTTISQNVEQKASLAVEILMERINGVEKERENEIMLPVTLIPRRSVQPQHEEK